MLQPSVSRKQLLFDATSGCLKENRNKNPNIYIYAITAVFIVQLRLVNDWRNLLGLRDFKYNLNYYSARPIQNKFFFGLIATDLLLDVYNFLSHWLKMLTENFKPITLLIEADYCNRYITHTKIPVNLLSIPCKFFVFSNNKFRLQHFLNFLFVKPGFHIIDPIANNNAQAKQAILCKE